MRRIGVLHTALDLAAAALWIAWGMGEAEWGGYLVVRLRKRCAGVGGRKEAKRYVGSWLGGFEWPIFVGVDAFGYGKTGS
ncbi:hypothetical protein EAH_00068000 [Eimeria acervulina]|uniref:Uncharacterized protein n=1 Tax=Eimeria acervulina TaxID=5801 RepID=U6GWL0_EIMAC|nr:hypothetical protein EAH_00068000 [Eimeria acervulina]CDI82949.1 hypothetical protein EAH_00068000 [Eimeria acervulina]